MSNFVLPKIILAPMAGVADAAFRKICRDFGAEYVYTEMVSSRALVHSDKKSVKLLIPAEGEHPFAAQIFGSEPDAMREGAIIAADISGAEVIDINMGCPMGKIVSNGDGAALMRDLDKASRIIDAVMSKSPVPVTVKFRTGWDKGSINCVELAQRAESLGVSAVCLHGRTRSQLYSGKADWDQIKAVKQAVNIPVIANGDVFSANDAEHILRYTGADAVMVGRASFGRPWIFSEIKAKLYGTEGPAKPDINMICDTAMRQFELAAELKGERVACLEARKHYAWYLKGIPYAGFYKEKVTKVENIAQLYELTKGIRRDLVVPDNDF